MGFLLLVALGTALNVWWISEAVDAWDDDDDDSTQVRNPDPDADPDSDIEVKGTDGTNEVLASGDGNDTIIGGPDDADTLQGNDGDDRIVLNGGAVATGGAGADAFVANSPDAVITDFTPGEDQLRFTYTNPGPLEDSIYDPVYDWQPDDDGLQLQEVDVEGNRTTIATLQGLTDPPPAGDLVQTEYSERAGQTVDRINGEELLFIQRITGDDEDDTVNIDNLSAMVEADLGAGDDTATVLAQRAAFDLGAGDDTYTSNTENNGLGADNYTPTGSYETVTGGAGNDTIIGGGGEIRALGGTGDDLIDFSASGTGLANGGDGNDTILGVNVSNVALEGAGLTLNGGDGDDSINADRLPGGEFSADTVDGGTGADTIIFGALDQITSGAGADALTLNVDLFDETNVPTLIDFDMDEDMLMIALPGGYAGAGTVTIVPRMGDTGSDILVDGQRVATSEIPLSDSSAISVVT
ncbi:calcium-binding protein [Roseovarius pelagicus]|uniref:Hemolysin-type calcium-binding repeat-containing protein n=1 Tax=Roseovarius pelagicus TaxID=2980108 RepID=A0ABY6D9U0_9RHOB|nr:hypothetical protein [Roseovarius pelagicus]UXX81948.1 hypothetical protein N7U68_12550 [Roseovarius pelagicus]